MPRSKSEAEALARLRARLQATQAAAEAMADEARAETGRPPPNGWDVPRRAEETGAELDSLLSLLGTLREVLPPELRAQLAELVKALLVFVRAVLDFAIEQLELGGRRGDEPDVEDIPIS